MRLRGTAPALLGIVLLVAACGGDDGDAADVVPDDAAPAAGEDDHDHDDDDDHDDHDHDDDHDDAGGLGAVEVNAAAYRLLVADGEAGQVTVLDTDTGEVLDTIEIPAPQDAPTMLATSDDGRYGFAVMYDRDAVQVIDSGVWTVDHGDHSHYYVAPPASLALHEGDSPAHVVAHDDYTAIFFDGDGQYRMLTAADLAQRAEGELLDADAPHHGVAVPWDEGSAIVSEYGDTEPDQSTLPPEVVVRDAEGEVVESGFPECPELHGEASAGHTVAFACADGILVLEEHGDHFDGHKLDYPDGDGRSGTLRGAAGLEVLVGNYDEDTMLVIEPEEHTVTPLELPASFSTFAVTAHGDGSLLGVSADGSLHVVDLEAGSATSIDGVVAEYSADATWTDPTPQLAVGPDALVYVSDPGAGQVHEVDLDAGSVVRSFDVEGMPFHVAVAG
ncbi:hypothetical protein [Phytoactinopolyspora limicola]|uniref:hypothetical protein n=1 Tax=Phytoactinopolyspora limicola TaxID=2715536 RepID=UPI00140B2E8C|nr:hypothetical protein [Phytoactinopolyspora limicola]